MIIPDETSFKADEVSNLKDENEQLKSKFLRLDNIKDDDNKFQFWTNLPNYAVFSA